jgi:acyl carrier protein
MNAQQRLRLDDITTIVRQRLPNGPSHTIDDETDLFDLGLDSMGLISVTVALEQRFECYFDLDDLQPEKFRTVASIARLLSSKIA